MIISHHGHLRVKDGTSHNEPGPAVSSSSRAVGKNNLPAQFIHSLSGPAMCLQAPGDPVEVKLLVWKRPVYSLRQILLQKFLDFFFIADETF